MKGIKAEQSDLHFQEFPRLRHGKRFQELVKIGCPNLLSVTQFRWDEAWHKGRSSGDKVDRYLRGKRD